MRFPAPRPRARKRRCLAGSFRKTKERRQRDRVQLFFSPPFLLILSSLFPDRSTTLLPFRFPFFASRIERVKYPSRSARAKIQINVETVHRWRKLFEPGCTSFDGLVADLVKGRKSARLSREGKRRSGGRSTVERFRSWRDEVFARRIPIHGSANIDFQLPCIRDFAQCLSPCVHHGQPSHKRDHRPISRSISPSPSIPPPLPHPRNILDGWMDG